MGAANSKVEEDKALRLCRERKKFVKQALHGRCSLATAHSAYIQSLRCTGIALRIFVEPDGPVESSLYSPAIATPEPLAFTEKSVSQFSFSSPSLSQHVDSISNHSPLPSPPSSSRFQAHHMKFRGSFSNKIEEKVPLPVIGTVTSSDIPPSAAPQTSERHQTPSFKGSSVPQEGHWDYFFPSTNLEFSFQDGNGVNGGFEFENVDDLSSFKEEDGNSERGDREEKGSFHGEEESQNSEDEFDEPASETLVRSFENFNRVHDDVTVDTSPSMPKKSTASVPELVNREKMISPGLSPLRTVSAVVPFTTGIGKETAKEDGDGDAVVHKDFFSSIREIETLFIKASDSGKEVPRMLEANKLHIRPIFPGKENHASLSSTLLKSCFSCGDDPSVVREEPPQTATKYLTWHRTASSRSSSSRNPLGGNSKEDIGNQSSNLFENFCMNSGSHASTLDRLYAWEKKLYDEIKASEMVRKEYDMKCKMLRHLESKEVGIPKIDKTRAIIKDLHSRIRVAVHRIDSISKKIEELRDKELQPQLEELIEGLSRMWEVMFECHKLQLQIIKAASNPNMKISMQSETQRHNTIYLESELASLSSSFMKWIAAQKSYLQSIDGWLLKCVSLPQKSTRGKRRPHHIASIRNYGPPIYVTCGFWLEKINNDLPTKEVIDSIKDLAAETARFLPRQEKKQGKGASLKILTSFKGENENENESMANNLLKEEASESLISGFDHFRPRLVSFLEKLNNFAESSVKMYGELEKTIQDAKSNYDLWKSQELERQSGS